MQSTPSFVMFFTMEAHHPESVSTMLALLANFFWCGTAFFSEGFCEYGVAHVVRDGASLTSSKGFTE
jgi:hypothetical protein